MKPLALAIGLVALAACGPSPLTGGHPSADSLARAALDALARSDRESLHALALSEQEFRNHVWPELPAARPERNLPFSYVWGDLRQKSETSLVGTLAEHGGRRYVLQKVAFDGQPTEYPGFRVHRDAVLIVKDETGITRDIRICGSLFEKDGRWKIFSYVVED